MRWNTSSPSRKAGIAFGDTNEPASIRVNPHVESLSISAILSSVSTHFGSICKPSRGATS